MATSEVKSKQMKSLVGGVLKRIVGKMAKEKRSRKVIDVSNSLSTTLSKRIVDCGQDLDLTLVNTEPEVLRVSPMDTSCEVTLISFSDDEPETCYKISVNHAIDQKHEESYHIVVNHSRTAKNFDDDHHSVGETNDVAQELTNKSATQDMNEALPSSHLEHEMRKNICTENRDSEKNCVIPECVDSSDYECRRPRQDFFVKKDSIFYESLFVASDSEDDDDEEENLLFRRNNNQWFIDGMENNFPPKQNTSKPDASDKPCRLLNITLDTAVDDLSFIDDEYSM
ncbi:unnamed protein product [Pseudo-nitzschia multistriata]|uniref:Uncharacterized protein n=1 Tax=Pseudo-nitzschia multistriata TaxID=183589 RepID=A0A448YVB8_9STRA|nr:unnamed protein product [Pseudo-nitzschia multistriata]